jgi:hypothetical protein
MLSVFLYADSLHVYEATKSIGGHVKGSGKAREPPIGPRAMNSSSVWMPMDSHTYLLYSNVQ